MELTIGNPIITLEEYIRSEEASDIRHEFIDGKLTAMSGATRYHNFICQNILRALYSLLPSKGYYLFIESIKVKITGEQRYYYPDILLTREPQTNENVYIQYQPELIVEVLSDSTRIKDSGEKFSDYKKIPSLQYYLLVEPEKVWVSYYYKNANGIWQNEIFTQLNESVFLRPLEINLPLEKIYKT